MYPHPLVPLFRRRERGNALQGAPPCAPTPLVHSVGEGLGVRATKMRTPPHAAHSSDVPLSALSPSPAGGRGGTRCRAHRRAPLHPAPTAWERGNALQGAPPCAPTPRAHSVGEGECAAGRTAVRPYTPRPQRGRGAGGEGYKNAHTLHAANSSDVPLSGLSPTLWERGRRAPTVLEC